MSAKENLGKKVKNSNCNGIPLADDPRKIRSMYNEHVMKFPVPVKDDIGKTVIINVGALGRSIPELGLIEKKKEHQLYVYGTERYAGIIKDIIGNLVFIERVFRVPEGETWDCLTDDGVKIRKKVCCIQLMDFKSGYARYVVTPKLYTKHLLLPSGGGGKKTGSHIIKESVLAS